MCPKCMQLVFLTSSYNEITYSGGFDGIYCNSFNPRETMYCKTAMGRNRPEILATINTVWCNEVRNLLKIDGSVNLDEQVHR